MNTRRLSAIIFIVILLIGGYFFFSQRVNERGEMTLNTDTDQTTTSEEEENDMVDENGMKTYRNERFGFEFQYPGDITIRNTYEKDDELFLQFCGEKSCGKGQAGAFIFIESTSLEEIALEDFPDITHPPLDPYVNRSNEVRNIVHKENITIDGISGISVLANDGNSRILQFIHRDRLVTIKGGAHERETSGMPGIFATSTPSILGSLNFF